jgi:uncharacterized membrane-anchored protein YjiN (DUF445 family)
VKLARFNPAQPARARHEDVATGLLIVMAVIFFTTRAYVDEHPWLGSSKPLRKRPWSGAWLTGSPSQPCSAIPLGLPIPHTAIIPRNKDRIGDTLAAFIRDNFLVASVVARRMRGIDLASAAGASSHAKR